jgi:hypothetical protein
MYLWGETGDKESTYSVVFVPDNSHFITQGGNMKVTKMVLTHERWIDGRLNLAVADVGRDKICSYRCHAKTR